MTLSARHHRQPDLEQFVGKHATLFVERDDDAARIAVDEPAVAVRCIDVR